MKCSRIAIHDLKPGTVDASIRLAESDLLPLFRSQPGFISYAVYRVENDAVASVSTWEDRGAAERALEAADGWVKQNLASSIVSSRVCLGELAFDSEESAPLAEEETRAPAH